MKIPSARTVALLGALLAACSAMTAARAGVVPRPASFAEHQKQCAGKDGWSDPAPPVRIFGNVYDVGTCGITVLLIAGEQGAILLDGATVEAVPVIVANIKRLGFRLSDVKLLLSSHEHHDHAGGLKQLRQLTGAKMVAVSAAKPVLESGVLAPEDPQRSGKTATYPGVTVDRTVRDGEVVTLGSLRLGAHATPGHSPGGTTWSWQSCQGTTCHRMVYADSVSAVSRDGYRFSDHPADVARLRASLDKIAALPCDLIVTPHPSASNLYGRLAGDAPLSAADACSSYAAAGRAGLNRRLASEQLRPRRP